MSVLASAIAQFFNRNDISVGVIKGEWGVGKTYFWKHFIAGCDYAKSNRKTVFYVSLFGVKDREDLSSRILAGIEICDETNPKEPGFNWKNFTSKVAPYLRKFDSAKIGGVPLGSFSNIAFPFLERQMTSNSIICFDDIERSDGLSMKVFLGVVSEYAEQRNCKIVIIYNDSEMGLLSEGFERYREKVVDIEWLYEPSLDENLNKVWAEDIPESVEKAFESLQNKNLRVMQKVKFALQYFERFIAGSEDDLRFLVEERIALICIAYNAYPQFREYLETRDSEGLNKIYLSEIGLGEKQSERDPVKDRLEGALGWGHLEVDGVVRKFLSNGFVEPENVERLFSDKNHQLYQMKTANEFSAIWEMFRGNFGATQEVFIEKMRKFMADHHETFGIKDIEECRTCLLDLNDQAEDFDAYLNLAIGRYVDGCNSHSSARDRFIDSFSADTERKIRDQLKLKEFPISLDELFENLTDCGGYSPSKCRLLQQFSDEEVEMWLSSGRCAYPSLITVFLERFDSNEEGGKEFCLRLRRLLTVLAGRSSFDRIKVDRILGSKMNNS